MARLWKIAFKTAEETEQRQVKSMQKTILEAVSISRSCNISLYPTLAMNNVGRLGIAWYEYGSPHKTDRSDVWFSLQDANGTWTEPVNVSGGISYNSGPSLIWIHTGGYWCCAWHSWRPPGREPFIVNGDVTNIWLSNVSNDGVVQSPHKALSGVFNTEYASLAITPNDELQLLFHNRSLHLQYLTQSSKKIPLTPGPAFLGCLGAGQFGDLAFGPDGMAWIAYVGESGGIYLASRAQDGCWSQSRRIDTGVGTVVTRPKISVCPKGTVWVACHSSTWGSRSSRYHVRTLGSHLAIRFESTGSPGNHCWTCNAITLRGVGGERSFSFGPDVLPLPKGITPVTVEQSLYNPKKGYGFENPPKSQLRELGNELTRGLFYDDMPSTFRVDIPDGDYEIEVVNSSWIASTAGTRVFFEGEILDSQLPYQEHDAVFILQVRPDGEVQSMRISKGESCDENRPSKVIHDASTGRKHLAWTCYGPKKVEIVYASFTMP